MKVLSIIISVFIFWSFGFSQERPMQVNKNKSNYNDQKAEKVKSDIKNELTTEPENVNKISIDEKSNVVDIQKSSQKVIPKVVKNSGNAKTKQKKSFGSAATSGPKQILEKKPAQDTPISSETKDKVKKMFTKPVKLKKTE